MASTTASTTTSRGRTASPNAAARAARRLTAAALFPEEIPSPAEADILRSSISSMLRTELQSGFVEGCRFKLEIDNNVNKSLDYELLNAM